MPTMKTQSLFFPIVLLFSVSCSNSTNDNAGNGTMPYNSNSETSRPDTAGSTTAYNNSTTGTTYSTTSSTTNGRTTHGADDTLKYKQKNR
jgi:hypothetical protein